MCTKLPTTRNTSIVSVNKGFTLIELLITLSIMAVLSAIGSAAYVSYSHIQVVNNAILEVETALHTAKANAQNQVKPLRNSDGSPTNCDGAHALDYWSVYITTSPTSQYQLRVFCGDIITGSLNTYSTGSLPPGATFDTSDNTLELQFPIITGGVTGISGTGLTTVTLTESGQTGQYWQIKTNGYSFTKTLNVNSVTGNMFIAN